MENEKLRKIAISSLLTEAAFFVFMTVLLSSVLVPFLPFMLSFAAGAMLYVVMIELSGDFTEDNTREKGITSFILGFSVMMSLDVALG